MATFDIVEISWDNNNYLIVGIDNPDQNLVKDDTNHSNPEDVNNVWCHVYSKVGQSQEPTANPLKFKFPDTNIYKVSKPPFNGLTVKSFEVLENGYNRKKDEVRRRNTTVRSGGG